MQEKIRLALPVVVEGKYDKQKVLSVAEGTVVSLDGFSVFNHSEKILLLKRLCGEKGIILLTDSDSAGGFIRAKLKGYLPAEKIIHLYTPRIKGKEKRKKHPSKQGILGVEGVDGEIVRSLLLPFCGETVARAGITKARLYEDGLLGSENSGAKRDAVADALGIPNGMTPKAFLEAINIICSYEEYSKAVENI